MKIKTRNPDIKWRSLANKNGWTIRYPHENPGLENLKKRLLAIGGWAVCLSRYEPDLEKILERGIKFAGRAKMMRGQPSQCHFNSGNLWDNNRDNSFLCTGYALSRDGMWRQHSWVAVMTPKSYKVVETTEPRASYFGYILDRNEAEKFFYENCL